MPVSAVPIPSVNQKDDISTLMLSTNLLSSRAFDIIQLLNHLESDVLGGRTLNGLETSVKTSIIDAINDLHDKYSSNVLMRDITGELIDLDTVNKENLVSAINELNTDIGDLEDLKTVAKADLVTAMNEISDSVSAVGNLNDLQMSTKTSIVDALNEILSNIGSVVSLTTASDNLAGAVNELDSEIGNLSGLRTINKINLVSAINEIFSESLRFLRLDGGTTPVTDINWGGNKITNLKNGSSPQDAVAYGQVKEIAGVGDFNALVTTNKTNLVLAINEVYNNSIRRTNATGSAVVPTGTTAQRDGTPVNGYLRFNTTLMLPEMYYGGSWKTFGGNMVQTSTTGSARMPVGTTAQRDSAPSNGFLRYNSTINRFEGLISDIWQTIGNVNYGGQPVTDGAFVVFDGTTGRQIKAATSIPGSALPNRLNENAQPITSADTFNTQGWAYMTAAAATADNLPGTGAKLLQYVGYSTHGIQWVYRIGTTEETYFRYRNANVWGGWIASYTGSTALDNRYLNASNLSTGTVPEARLPARLSQTEMDSSYRNATNLNAGTVPDARLPARLSTTSLNAAYIPVTGGTVTGQLGINRNNASGWYQSLTLNGRVSGFNVPANLSAMVFYLRDAAGDGEIILNPAGTSNFLGGSRMSADGNFYLGLRGAWLTALLDAKASTADLAGKANTVHTHTIANVTGLQAALDAKPSAAVVNDRVHRVGIGEYMEQNVALNGWTVLPNEGWVMVGLQKVTMAAQVTQRISARRLVQHVPGLGGWQWLNIN